MMRILSVTMVTLLLVIGSIFFYNDADNTATVKQEHLIDTGINQSALEKQIIFDQEMLQLHHEAVQYMIRFHENDSITVSLSMFVSYVDETITSCYVLLTDGEKPLLDPYGLWYIPERKYLLVTPRIRLSIGRFWLVNFMNNRDGRLRFGSSVDDSGVFTVHSDDTWYLTIAVPSSCIKSGYTITIESTTESIEVTELTRHDHLGIYTASYNQFDGWYYALKFGILGGFSICNIHKDITTTDGCIIDAHVAGYRRGKLTVTDPDDQTVNMNEKKLMSYRSISNQTGTWSFTVTGRSLYFLMNMVLMYIDIDPHLGKPVLQM